MKIAMIIPKNLLKAAYGAADKYHEKITVIDGTMNEAITIAKELESKGYDCIIARGGTYTLLSNIGIKIPIIPVPITNLDIFQAISEAEKVDKDITIMAFNNMMPASDSYAKIADRKLRVIQVKDEDEVKHKLEELSKEKKKVVVGGGIINSFASQYNITPIVIQSGEESFVSAINDSIRIVQATRNEKEARQRINAIIENTKDGIICIDNKGIVNIANKTAGKMLNFNHKDLLWEEVDKILPELEIEDSFNNGIEETEILKMINGNKFIISKIPISVNKEIVDVIVIIKDIEEIHSLEEKIRLDIAETGHFARYRFHNVIGNSSKTKETIRIGKEYAKVNSTVLIQGETGTGKEVLAQSIHNHSERSNRAFVAVNCAAIPENLLESELFGYASGAFTGADRKGKRGLFEIAHEGTIFLDEISEMDPLLQSRLLRVLQEKQIMRIGDHKIIPIDVRVIAATNKDIYKLVKESKFREDLYYRLNVLRILITPIREKKEDILCFLDHFIEFYCNKLNKTTLTLSNEVRNYLMKYNWPGNVREIRNFCERLCVMSKEEIIKLEDINDQIFHMQIEDGFSTKCEEIKIDGSKEKNSIEIEGKSLEDIERDAIKNALINSKGNISSAALELGISRTTIWRKMKKYGMVAI